VTHPTITAKIEELNASSAAALLAKSTGNRPLRQQHIHWLADQIRSGQWRLTHQGVALSDTGRLLDGHHRLEAIKMVVGATVPVLVLRGFPDSTWSAIDCGVVRAVHDRISLTKDTSLNRRMVEVIQNLIRIESKHKGKMTADQVTKEWKELREALTAIFGMLPKPIVGVTRAPVLGALARYYQRYPKGALEFASMLRSPGGHSPAGVLRQWLIDSKGFTTGSSLADQIYWTSAGMMTLHFKGFASVNQVEMATEWWS
jgi:hypothetical protein